MGKFYVVDYDLKERNELYLFLKLLGFKWANGESINSQDHCFPFCIDVQRKVVYMTNTSFLREFKSQGGEMIGVSQFKKEINI